ncbi:hypothetical protein KJ644_01935, partial [Candidatus Dependentiae bacterium]|nr:hypothetical protein [Candidatus Dependentiae bacterium]
FYLNLSSYSLNSEEIKALNKNGQVIKRQDVLNFFRPANKALTAEKIDTDPIKLREAAIYSLNLLNSSKSNLSTTNPYILNQRLINIDRVKETLKFIIQLVENDQKTNYPYRILDPVFLNIHFSFLRWTGDKESAKNNGKTIFKDAIYLTHYATFEIVGSYQQSEEYKYALYSIINKNFENDLRFKISKQNILKGTLNLPEYKNKVKPLVWLSRDGLEEALMQGTAVVKMPDDKEFVFCVDKNNGFAYDKNIKDRKDQKRYWYFKPLNNNQKNKSSNLLDLGGVIFAGDIYNLGLGKIIAIRYKNRITRATEMRLGVLADSGGAFINNLYQLDFYGGIFTNYDDFYSWVRPMPKNVQAYIVVKK